MLKLGLIGLWAALVASLAGFAGSLWQARQAEGPLSAQAGDGHATSAEGLELKKTRSINVPMLADGEVKGYIVAQFAYTADAKTLKQLTVSPEMYLLDEAFREIYASPSLDFGHLEKYDLTTLAKSLIERMRVRLKADIVKDVLIQDFNYVARADIRR